MSSAPQFGPETGATIDLAALNEELRGLDAQRRVERAVARLPEHHVLSSSFGIQAAVSLHLVTRVLPRIPVVLVDTGYLFPETYRFIDTLASRLDLNLKIYRSAMSPAWLEARHGKLWEQGAAGIDLYNRIQKVQPMRSALAELHAVTWFAGLRRSQSTSRAAIEPVHRVIGGRFKVHPIYDWSDRDVDDYLLRHRLPYHPLTQQGYVSIGDWHTTQKLSDVDEPAEATRFFGLKRECGIHE
jgi:phosphoadenosine phosphosulfate reductase